VLGPHLPVTRNHPNIGPRINVIDGKGTLLAAIQTDPARDAGPGQFISPHGMAVDTHGDFYVGEVAYVSFSRSFPDIPKPVRIRCLQKLVKVTAR
jgi:hypothetical protein